MIDYNKKYRLIYINRGRYELEKLIKAGTGRKFEVAGEVLRFKIDSKLTLKIDTTKSTVSVDGNELRFNLESGSVYHFEKVLPKKKEK